MIETLLIFNVLHIICIKWYAKPKNRDYSARYADGIISVFRLLMPNYLPRLRLRSDSLRISSKPIKITGQANNINQCQLANEAVPNTCLKGGKSMKAKRATHSTVIPNQIKLLFDKD